ncbi:MAG: hypothetical protein ACPG8W_12565 [Candidatus Promineifilaceae bacterium]
MAKLKTKRISITIPLKTLKRLNKLVTPSERSTIVSELIEDYLDDLEAEFEQVERLEQRREQRQMWLERIRASGQKAADLFLP